MRAIASMAVVLFHFIGTEQFLTNWTILKYISVYGQYGVQMFFVISGFVIPFSLYKSKYKIHYYGKFVLKRIIRLDPPYLANILFIICLSYVLSKVSSAQFTITWKQLLLHLGYLNAFFHEKWLNVVFWTLSVEFQYYVLLGLIYPLLIGNQWIRSITVISLLALSILFHDIPRDFFFAHIPVFLMGILTFQWYTRIIPKWEYIVWTFVCILFIYTSSIEILFVSIISVLLLFYFTIENKWLTFLGDISYSLYLMHVMTGSVVISIVKKRTDNIYIEFFALVFAVSISVTMSYLLYRFVEQPSQKLSSKIRFTNKSNSVTV
ncbi:acyltransferase [Xanthocytophaga agilis]|nr:acyltransferase [Xanthocytophaga agilis]